MTAEALCTKTGNSVAVWQCVLCCWVSGHIENCTDLLGGSSAGVGEGHNSCRLSLGTDHLERG